MPQELDVRAAGGVLRGGSVPARQSGSGAPASQNAVQALAQWRTVDAAQTKALQSRQSEVKSNVSAPTPAIRWGISAPD